MQSFSEIIILLEKVALSEKYGLIIDKTFYCPIQILYLPQKHVFLVFLNNIKQKFLCVLYSDWFSTVLFLLKLLFSLDLIMMAFRDVFDIK